MRRSVRDLRRRDPSLRSRHLSRTQSLSRCPPPRLLRSLPRPRPSNDPSRTVRTSPPDPCVSARPRLPLPNARDSHRRRARLPTLQASRLRIPKLAAAPQLSRDRRVLPRRLLFHARATTPCTSTSVSSLGAALRVKSRADVAALRHSDLRARSDSGLKSPRIVLPRARAPERGWHGKVRRATRGCRAQRCEHRTCGRT